MPEGGLSNLLTWRDIAGIKERDNKVILELLGSLVLPSSYVHGCASDRSGRRTNYCIQQRVTGKSLYAIIRDDPVAVTTSPRLRRDLLKIAWGTRRIVVELGATPDFHEGRNILFTEEQRPVLNDTGFPSFLANVSEASGLPLLIRFYCSAIVDFHLDFILRLESALHPTSREIAELSARFQVSDNAYEARVANIRRRKAELKHRIPMGGFITALDRTLRKARPTDT